MEPVYRDTNHPQRYTHQCVKTEILDPSNYRPETPEMITLSGPFFFPCEASNERCRMRDKSKRKGYLERKKKTSASQHVSWITAGEAHRFT